jgi:hypothetical protein
MTVGEALEATRKLVPAAQGFGQETMASDHPGTPVSVPLRAEP